MLPPSAAAPEAEEPAIAGPTSPASSFPGIEPIGPVEAPSEETQETGFKAPWPLLAAGGALLALLLGGLFAWRRRSVHAAPPEIERPQVAARNEQTSRVVASAPDVQIRAEALKLTRSLANATLDYRVTLINRSTSALSGISLGADLVSAHGDQPAEQQVATPSSLLDRRHVFDRIAPGQSVRYEGKLLLSLAQARVIRQGNMALLVPLLRIRLDGAGDAPIVRTFVVGQGVADGGRVAPFRLDEGMRSWEPVAARALD